MSKAKRALKKVAEPVPDPALDVSPRLAVFLATLDEKDRTTMESLVRNAVAKEREACSVLLLTMAREGDYTPPAVAALERAAAAIRARA